MIKNDYLIRMIEEMGAMLRKILAHEQAREYKAAHAEIDVAMKTLGLPRVLARSMPASDLMRIVRRPGAASDERCFMLSRLIGADAHIYRSEGSADIAHNLYTTELFILNALQKDAEGEKSEMIGKEIEAVRFSITETIHDHQDLGA
jgi:hypothetical protein